MLNKISRLVLVVIMLSFCASFSITNADWRPYQYQLLNGEPGEYRWGVRNGSEKVPLNNKSKKAAKKAAKKLNKADKGVRDLHEPGCNQPGVVC